MNFDDLVAATGATPADAIRYVDPLNESMSRFAINTPSRMAAFLATVAVESTNLHKVEEDLYYKDAARLASIYPRAFRSAADAQLYTRNSKGLSALLYKGYHGRGLGQLTWEDNYRAAGDALGLDLIGEPALLLQPDHAASSAAWFFTAKGCLPFADKGDMTGVTRIVNGKRLMHLERRIAQYHIALKVFA